MGAGHDHDAPAPVDPLTRRILAMAVVACGLAAVIAAALTWPADENENIFNLGAELFAATVEGTRDCTPDDTPLDAEDIPCYVAQIVLDEGPDAGQLFEMPPFFDRRVELEAGDELIVAQVVGEGAPFQYAFQDRNRKSSLFQLAALFAVAVVMLGGLRGASALAGLVTTVAILGLYMLPALLEGQSALPVACVTAALVAVVSLYTSHGFTSMTTVAILGTMAALALTVFLGTVFIDLTQLSGFATEESLFIEGVGSVDVRGLLLAGLVIGALGALDDVTVTQASVVFELRRSDPSASRRSLFAAGMRVGRDHVASTVNTLFLAYAGASLPLLLLFSVGQRPVLDVANSEVVATEIVRTLVGSIGLVASVPLTTWLAVSVVGDGSDGPKVPSGQRPPKRRTPDGEMPPALEDWTDEDPVDGTSIDGTSIDSVAPSRWRRLRDGVDD